MLHGTTFNAALCAENIFFSYRVYIFINRRGELNLMLSTDYSCKSVCDMFFGHQPKEKMRILCLYYIILNIYCDPWQILCLVK